MISMNTGPYRLSLATLLAAPLVYGLFLAANALITVREVTLVVSPQRVLERVTPEITEPGKPRTKQRPVPLEAAQKPPPPPRPAVASEGLVPTGPVWGGEAPERFDVGKISFGAISASPIDGRELVAVRPPVPTIPAAAVSRGISGSCNVTFDVDTAGRPQNVAAQCTDNVFRAEAERAVRRAEFLPAIRNGQPVIQKNAVYPIEFIVE
ncbi:MAG: energy transducer TonB [Hyphomonas sp.]|uniref:energy transducer TonB n=1 Tax=Hyphomonas sp. TaxID=87 RepID=UPI001DA4DA4A|nr:energy transducer TonB [Hyphomonas sp.]MBA4225927.1 energy transducer TonB [Hyphomonas sp.]